MNNKTTVRIYKDNFRESILRSLIFTDFVISILVELSIAGIMYVIFSHVSKNFNVGEYIGSVLLFEILFIALVTQKRDNQPIYKLVYRAIFFFTGKRKLRSKQLESYFADFKIQDDVIIRKKSISKVFLINPHDISALNEVDTVQFFARVKQALHSLPTQLQIVVRKELMTPDDINDHLASIYKTLTKKNKKREEIIQQYNHDLKERVATGNYLITRQYGVFAQEVDTNNVKQKVDAMGKLEDMYRRFDFSLTSCEVSTRQLTNNELVLFVKKVLQ